MPYVSKATSLPLAKIAARAMVGQKLAQQGVTKEGEPPYFSVKEAVFPFVKFPTVDPVLGPEMRSTGEVMGVGQTFGEALFKSQLAAGSRLPESGTVLLTVMDADKPKAVEVARMLQRRVIAAALQGGVPTVQSSQYKLYMNELGQRVANWALDAMSAAGQLKPGEADAPVGGRFERSYRYTVVDTIGGGTSEIQKNIIARRGLGLPRCF